MSDHIAAFRDALSSAGITPPDEIIDDGKVHRFSTNGKRHDKAGRYVLYGDAFPAGYFLCYRSGIFETWRHNEKREYTDEEKREWAQRMEQIRAQREADQKAAWKEASDLAATVWDAAVPATADHPYLQRKGIQPHIARVGRWTRYNEDGEIWLDVPNALIIPIKNGKRLASLQAIFPDKDNALKRDKDFISGGKKRGCFCVIGSLGAKDNPASIAVICEGYATGASIHEATGYPVVIAFDAGNLNAVAERIRAALSAATLVLAADNDQWTTQPVENPGVHYATEAGKKHRCWVAIPQFADLSSRPTDFNDLAQQVGLDEVAVQINDVLPRHEPAPIPENSPATQDYRAVDTYSPLPDINSKGTPLSTIENLDEVCRRLGYIIRYNVIKKEEEILIPGESFSVDNQANASLAHLLSWCGRFRMPVGQLGSFVTAVADRNLYNPVAQWIESRPWDGTSRLPEFMGTVRAKNEPHSQSMKETLILRWMISAVAAVFRPNGVSAHGVLVFQGSQYLGKTKWFKSLAPSDFIMDGVTLDPKDKDSVKQAVSCWLVELGEIDATFRKSDIAQLKAFITKDKDVLRRAYAKCESTYARRTVFFASVNPKNFLKDATGNRRYWTIECEHLDHSHSIDMQQVWAEITHLWRGGEGYYLTPDEMDELNKSNEDFSVIDPIEEKIKTRLEWDDPQTFWQWSTATDILNSIGFDRPTVADSTRCAMLIRELNGNQAKRTGSARLLLAPKPIRNN